MKVRRGVLLGARAFALCYVAAMLFLKLFESRLVYYPSRAPDAAPGDLGRPFEEAVIPFENGEQIHAWYFPAHPGQVQASDHAILVCHGNAGNISHRLELARLLLDVGGSVLLFDYRGYGQSSGKPGEERSYRDAQAAWHWLTQKGFAGTNIVAYGESLGGAVAAELAVREPLGGLILQSTFTSIPDVGAEIYWWLPVRLIASIRYDTLRKLPGLKIPVLILHSRQDELVPFHHAEKNFAAVRGPKYFCEMDGGHNDGFFQSRAKIAAALTEFMQKLSVPHLMGP
jgi:uncharacterized protein